MTTLTYNGSGEGINGVPARDLTEPDIIQIAAMWQLSIIDTTNLLCSRGLYSRPTQPKKTKQAEPPTEIVSEPVDKE